MKPLPSRSSFCFRASFSYCSVLLRAASVFCVAVTLVACSISDRISYIDEEGEIPESFFEEVRKNKTKKSWIVSQLGEPFLVETKNEFQEIYTYRFTRSHYRNGQLLLVLRYGRVEKEVEYYHLAFERNVVKKHWLDEYAYVQIHDGAIRGFTKLSKLRAKYPAEAKYFADSKDMHEAMSRGESHNEGDGAKQGRASKDKMMMEKKDDSPSMIKKTPPASAGEAPNKMTPSDSPVRDSVPANSV